MNAVATGHRAGFDIAVWQCEECRRYEASNRRVDDQSFWLGAMGRALVEETQRLIAEHRAGPTAPSA